MSKTMNANGIKITSDSGKRFDNQWQAMEAAQMMQGFIAGQGYCVTSTFNLDCKVVEITVYFENKPFPRIKNGYKYSTKEIHSHIYFNEYIKKPARVRTIDFSYKY